MKKNLVSQKKVEDQGALAVQVGGGHYKKCAIQPVEYAIKNQLNFCQGNIVKYATRYADKNGPEDLEKVKHYVDLLIELEYPEYAAQKRKEKSAAAVIAQEKLVKEIKAKLEANRLKAENRAKVKAQKSKLIKQSKELRRPVPPLFQKFTPSAELAVVVGTEPQCRTDIVKKLWAHIKKHNLQNPKNKRNILTDDKLKAIFNKNEVSMFELASLLGKHLK